MRKIGKQQDQDGAEIDLTPMLDVVFIMLIFFIVVASFIKEAGIEVNRPDDNQPQDPNDAVSIVVEVASDGQIWMENRRVRTYKARSFGIAASWAHGTLITERGRLECNSLVAHATCKDSTSPPSAVGPRL